MRVRILVLVAVFLAAVGILALIPVWNYHANSDLRAIEQEAGMTVREALELCDDGVYAHNWYAEHPKACIDQISGNATHNLEWVSKYERLEKLVKLLAESARNNAEGGGGNRD